MKQKAKFERKFWCKHCKNKRPFDFAAMCKHVSFTHGMFFPMRAHRSGLTTFVVRNQRLFFRNEFTWWIDWLRLEEVSEGPA